MPANNMTIGRKSKIATNCIFMTGSFFALFIFNFIFSILAARLLGVSGFGQLTYALSYATLFFIPTDAGISFAITKLIAKERGERSDLLTIGFTLRIAMIIPILCLSIAFLGLTPYSYTTVSILILISMALQNIILYTSAVLRGMERMFAASSIPRLYHFGITISLVVLYLVHGQIIHVAWAILLSSLTASLVSLYVLRPRIGFRLNKRLLKYLMKESFAHIFLTLWDDGNLFLMPLMLTYLCGYNSTGIFQAAFKIAVVPMFFSSALGHALFPSFSSDFRMVDRNSVIIQSSSATRLILSFVLPFSLVFVLFSDNIVNILYGNQYGNSASLLILLCPFIVTRSVLLIYLYLMSAVGKHWLMAKIAAISIAMNILLGLLLITYLNEYGSAITLSFVNSFSCILSVQLLRRYNFVHNLKFRTVLLHLLAFSTTALVSVFIEQIVQINNIFAVSSMIIFSFFSYIFILLVFGELSSEKRLLFDIIRELQSFIWGVQQA